MNEESNSPKTLMDAIRYFADPDKALGFMVQLRWPNGVACPHCGSLEVRFISTRRMWECKSKHAKRQFTVKVGTIMEDSPLPLDKWLAAIWMIANAKNGVSSYEIHRSLGITQKSAWFLSHRIRLAMQTGSFLKKLTGEVEVDETFIGGAARNMHKGKRKVLGSGTVGKAVVLGILERKGQVKTMVVPNTKRHTLHGEIKQHVEPGSKVYTDALRSYEGLAPEYLHAAIDHAECYAKGNIHTNGLENFWSLLKRCIDGTYVAVEPFHLFRYMDEQTFRYNNRQAKDGGRFLKVLESICGKRVTYRALTGQECAQPST